MKMSLLVFGALAMSFLLRRRSAAVRHWVLAAGIACAAAMPILTAAMPAWPLPFATPTAFTEYEDPFRAAPAVDTGAAARPGTPAAATPSKPATSSAEWSAAGFVKTIWLAGTMAGLGILLTGVLRLAWLARHARPITSGRWYQLSQEIAHGYGLHRPVTLLQSDHPSLLVTWGIVRPKVILPSAADAWTEERARVVLSHELAHIRRGDWVVQLSGELLRAFYWFNPLLWVVCRQLRLQSEHACDDEVMRRGVEGSDYAAHLIDLARALNQRRMWLPAPAMARPSSLERRVRAMLNNDLDRESLSIRTRAVIFAAVLCAATAVAAAQSGFSTFTGSISDESSRGIPGATVTLTNEARQAKYEVKTNSAGRFEFVGLPAGEYGFEGKGPGFQPLRDVVTITGQNLQRTYTLKLGMLQETINVVDDGHDRDQRPAPMREIVPKVQACTPTGTGGHIVPPKKIRDYAPVFPASLRGSVVNASVVMEGRIALDGYVTDIRIIGDAHPELASSAITAIREWKFTQTLLNCEPADVLMTITVNFKSAAPPPPASL